MERYTVFQDGKMITPEHGRKKVKRVGKMTFVEHRTAFHVYHSFHRLWIFLTVMLQVGDFVVNFKSCDRANSCGLSCQICYCRGLSKIYHIEIQS